MANYKWVGVINKWIKVSRLPLIDVTWSFCFRDEILQSVVDLWGHRTSLSSCLKLMLVFHKVFSTGCKSNWWRQKLDCISNKHKLIYIYITVNLKSDFHNIDRVTSSNSVDLNVCLAWRLPDDPIDASRRRTRGQGLAFAIIFCYWFISEWSLCGISKSLNKSNNIYLMRSN